MPPKYGKDQKKFSDSSVLWFNPWLGIGHVSSMFQKKHISDS